MLSRMEKYYKADNAIKKRTRVNEELYKKIYEDAEYTNIEGITNIEKTNEIDLSKIRELLDKQKDNNQEKEDIKNKNDLLSLRKDFVLEEDKKNYDIHDVLDKAKNERDNADERYHSLKNTQYNILKKINLKENLENQEYIESEEELKKLINTITNTSMLNKLGDKELSLNILDELKASGNTITETSRTINAILEEAKAQEQPEEEKREIDKSFYTSSFSFNEGDFEDLKEINVTLKKNNILIKILLFILIVIILTGAGYVFYNFLR